MGGLHPHPSCVMGVLGKRVESITQVWMTVAVMCQGPFSYGICEFIPWVARMAADLNNASFLTKPKALRTTNLRKDPL